MSVKLSLTNDALNKESQSSKHLYDENARLLGEVNSLREKCNELNKENVRVG